MMRYRKASSRYVGAFVGWLGCAVVGSLGCWSAVWVGTPAGWVATGLERWLGSAT
jgi:hypothetical protein